MPLTTALRYNAYNIVKEMLTGRKENPAAINEVWDACNTLKKDGYILQADCLTYQVLEALSENGLLKIVKTSDSGAFPEYQTYKYKFYI